MGQHGISANATIPAAGLLALALAAPAAAQESPTPSPPEETGQFDAPRRAADDPLAPDEGQGLSPAYLPEETGQFDPPPADDFSGMAPDLPPDLLAPVPPEERAELRQVYSPAYFAAFAPRNALDMLEQVPGFSIEGPDNARGLGQASGNVLINGERPSSKSDNTQQQLSRISASDVVRIEIADGATLEIPGLSGQVANIVVESSGFGGQFSWRPQYNMAIKRQNFTQGDISISGSTGPADFTVALSNFSRRSGSDGPSQITAGDGSPIEDRWLHTRAHGENPKLSGSVRFDGPGSSVANVSASHSWPFERWRRDETRTAPGQPDGLRKLLRSNDGRNYEISGDIEFALGPGRLKLIALDSFDTSDFATQSVLSFEDDSDPEGSRYERHSESGERIGRAEYRWPMLGGDWQFSAEAAFNRLDNVAGLFSYTPAGEFAQIPFPAGTGGVTEDRFETILSYGRPLTGKLTLQIAAGAEYSKLRQTGSKAEEREFRRPKGSFSLSWSPDDGLDISFKVNRRVGQLQFGDFLAQVFVDKDNSNAGNNQLVPEQSWEFELDVAKGLGRWGTVSLDLYDSRIEDVVTIIPLPGGLESLGNVASARRYGLSLDSTIQFEPLGLSGARLDLQLALEDSEIADPLTGEIRQIDRTTGLNFDAELRHDIPQSNWAWGVHGRYTDYGRYYRIEETGREFNIQNFGAAYVENKDVLGLTIRATFANLFDATSHTARTIHDGPRDISPILYREYSNRKLGRFWTLEFKGDF